jgi:hypothetical protein
MPEDSFAKCLTAGPDRLGLVLRVQGDRAAECDGAIPVATIPVWIRITAVDGR